MSPGRHGRIDVGQYAGVAEAEVAAGVVGVRQGLCRHITETGRKCIEIGAWLSLLNTAHVRTKCRLIGG